jgi:hypothetical protein
VDESENEEWPESIPRPTALDGWKLDEIGDSYVRWENTVVEVPFEIELSEAFNQYGYRRPDHTHIYVTHNLEVDDHPEVGREVLQALADAFLTDTKRWVAKRDEKGYRVYKRGEMELDEDGWSLKIQVPTRSVDAWIDRVTEALSDPSVQDVLQWAWSSVSTSTSDQSSPEGVR